MLPLISTPASAMSESVSLLTLTVASLQPSKPRLDLFIRPTRLFPPWRMSGFHSLPLIHSGSRTGSCILIQTHSSATMASYEQNVEFYYYHARPGLQSQGKDGRVHRTFGLLISINQKKRSRIGFFSPATETTAGRMIFSLWDCRGQPLWSTFPFREGGEPIIRPSGLVETSFPVKVCEDLHLVPPRKRTRRAFLAGRVFFSSSSEDSSIFATLFAWRGRGLHGVHCASSSAVGRATLCVMWPYGTGAR